ncbi:TKL/TKL-ccin protein kinase [Mycena albidolilacea]|uniref:TKL/TKL-ccin protein kinase n=1 Tax=Mycena albidolilacea TaxID=1033008 RepID=A0AAD6ZWA5_9AGAR|nr:TKL/TKL-ccin protein kinase [Mycena albidolilacea]
MDSWLQLDRVQGFLRQAEIAKDIECCHRMLTDCWGSLQVLYHFIQFARPVTRDSSQRISDHRELMMGNNLRTTNKQHNGLSSNLYDLQFKTHELLPGFNLRSGEVIRVGQFPVSGTSVMDIYEGLYLGREKVAIKVVRAIHSNEHSQRVTFDREYDIWKKLWKIDQGQHVLPFYGFCQEDGVEEMVIRYMVSPWQVSAYHRALILVPTTERIYRQTGLGVALGLQVLHSMDPHIVHGDIKASNIVIDSGGNPLIADFGLSRIVENITWVPFSQSRGVSDSYRRYASEICIGQGVLSLSSDIYAYGMTVLEIFMHEQPYNNIKHATEVVIRSAKGEKPPRPTANKVIRRGLDDDMWELLCFCWATEPSQRPTIQQVLDLLSSASASILDHTGILFI